MCCAGHCVNTRESPYPDGLYSLRVCLRFRLDHACSDQGSMLKAECSGRWKGLATEYMPRDLDGHVRGAVSPPPSHFGTAAMLYF